MALGSLVVSLGLDAAEFTSGLSKSEYQARKFASNFRENMKASFAGNFLADFAAQAVRELARLPGAVLDSVAAFQELGEKMGTSASSVATLQEAADISGTSLDTVAAASIRLTSTLVKQDGAFQDAAKALKAINIPIEEFKKLDPVSQFRAVAEGMAKFEDGTGKTAVALQLFGRRGGAEVLPFLKDLADAQGTHIKLTDDQILAADRFGEQMAAVQSQLKNAAQVILVNAIPAVTGLLTGLTNMFTASSTLGQSTAISDFAFGAARALAVLVESTVVVGKGVRALIGSFEAVFADINLVSEFAAHGSVLGLVFESNRKAMAEALEKRNKTVEEANKRYVELWNFDSTAISKAIEAVQKNGLPGSGAKLPSLNFTIPDENADKLTEAQRYIRALEKTFEATQKLTEYEQLMWDIEEGRLKDITPKQLNYAIGVAQAADAAKLYAEDQKDVKNVLDDLTNAAAKTREETKKLAEELKVEAQAWIDLADPMGKFIRDLEKIDELVRKGALEAGTAKMVKANLGEKIEEDNTLTEYAKSAAQNMQSYFADFLFDPFKDGVEGMAKNFALVIHKMITEAAAANLMKSLFGDDPSKWFSTLLTLNGGGNSAGLPEGAPFATGTNFVPYDGMKAVLHRGEAVIPAKYNPAAGGKNPMGMPQINQTFYVTGGASRAEVVRATQAGKDQAMAEIADAMRRGNL
jgi:hypothetical protein